MGFNYHRTEERSTELNYGYPLLVVGGLPARFKNGFAEIEQVRHTPRPVKSVTIQINDLFEFEGQPVPAQRFRLRFTRPEIHLEVAAR